MLGPIRTIGLALWRKFQPDDVETAVLASTAVFFHFVPVRAAKISFRAENNAQIILCGIIYLNCY